MKKLIFIFIYILLLVGCLPKTTIIEPNVNNIEHQVNKNEKVYQKLNKVIAEWD